LVGKKKTIGRDVKHTFEPMTTFYPKRATPTPLAFDLAD